MSTISKPHPHAAVIKAWADGAKVQIRVQGSWVDANINEVIGDCMWHLTVRVKPENEVRFIPVIKTPAQGMVLQVAKRSHKEAVDAHQCNSGLVGVLRIEINPETMQLVSATLRP
jgi:hypothetical protein